MTDQFVGKSPGARGLPSHALEAGLIPAGSPHSSGSLRDLQAWPELSRLRHYRSRRLGSPEPEGETDPLCCLLTTSP